MAISMKLKKFLDENKVSYQVAAHSEVYTAQEIAAALHVPGKELIKVVMVKAGDSFVMTVLPASRRIDMVKLREVLGNKAIRLATEEEFKTLFPDCEPGAMPPFGNLYGLDVYADKALTDDEEIFFQAGSHIESIKMRYKDYERLVKPKVADFSTHLY
ncbi:MAG: YbaK/EbsC family protein [Deltaproteobacteria bacterium]|nr:YbaK/EbsC family protein [Deltaproteobacteria bacterium]MBI3755746.1 YbaK/EbsC family protein [Deltaproteobacteria bacterium]